MAVESETIMHPALDTSFIAHCLRIHTHTLSDALIQSIEERLGINATPFNPPNTPRRRPLYSSQPTHVANTPVIRRVSHLTQPNPSPHGSLRNEEELANILDKFHYSISQVQKNQDTDQELANIVDYAKPFKTLYFADMQGFDRLVQRIRLTFKVRGLRWVNEINTKGHRRKTIWQSSST